MSQKRTLSIIGIVLGLALCQDALAFYNSTTGRWLSRDPIEEKGFKKTHVVGSSFDKASRSGFWSGIANVPAHDNRRTASVANSLVFCDNDGIHRSDSLGLEAKSPAELAGYCENPCKEYAADQREDNKEWQLDGAAICCGGKLYLCAWGHEQLKNSRARELVKECIEEHERTHQNKNHLEPCAPCNWRATKPGYGPGVNGNTAECEAHTAGVACLTSAMARCNGDAECEQEVDQARRAKESARETFCNRVPKPNGMLIR